MESNPKLLFMLHYVAVGNDESPVGNRSGSGRCWIAEKERGCEVADGIVLCRVGDAHGRDGVEEVGGDQ